MDSGDTNVGQCLDSYYDMPNVLRNAYEGEYNRSVLSIFDNSSSILGSLRLFTNLATVKVSDKIMGVDYNTREELLELENRLKLVFFLLVSKSVIITRRKSIIFDRKLYI